MHATLQLLQVGNKARDWKDVRKGKREDLLVLLPKVRAQLLHGEKALEA